MDFLKGLFDPTMGTVPRWTDPSRRLSNSGGPGVGDLVPLRSISRALDEEEPEEAFGGGGPGGGAYSGNRGVEGGAY